MASKPYNEMYSGESAARPHYLRYAQWLSQQPADRLAQKRAEADALFHRVGITFAVYGQEEGAERLIPFDIVPRVLPHEEWIRLEGGLKQRVRALNAFIHDIYHDQQILKAGVVPAEQVLCSSQYRPEMQGCGRPRRYLRPHRRHRYRARRRRRVPSSSKTTCAFPPASPAHARNRKMMMRLFPELFSGHRIGPVDHYPSVLLDESSAASPHRRRRSHRGLVDRRRAQQRLFRARVSRSTDGHRTGRRPGSLRP